VSSGKYWTDFSIVGNHREYVVFENNITKERRLALHPIDDSGLDRYVLPSFNEMTEEERSALLALAPEWHGTLLELIDTAKVLSR
jgi:hypothetical protein